MRKILFFLCFLSTPVLAQNVTCATRASTDSSNACASTAFVAASNSVQLPLASLVQLYGGTGSAGKAGVVALGTHLSISGAILATDATNANTASTIVSRDSSGNFSGGTFTGSVTGHASLDLPLTGGTLSGELITPASTTTNAGLNLGIGSAPTSPVNGDVWFTSAGFFFRSGGVTLGPIGSSNITVGTTAVGSGTNGGVLTNNGGNLGNTSAGTLGQALVSGGAGVQPTFVTGGRTLLNTLTASNSANLTDTTSFTSNYSEYDIIFENVYPAINAVACGIQVQSGGTIQNATYNSGGIIATSTGAGTMGGITSYIPCGEPNFVPNSAPGISATFHVSNVAQTSTYKNFIGSFAHPAIASTYATGTAFGYWGGGTGAITGIQILFTVGNITAGVVKIYGSN